MPVNNCNFKIDFVRIDFKVDFGKVDFKIARIENGQKGLIFTYV